MKFTKIHTHEEFLELKRKLHEACMKANSELTQEEMLQMMEESMRRRKEEPDYPGYRRLLEQQAIEERKRKDQD